MREKVNECDREMMKPTGYTYEFGIEAKLLDDTSVLAASEFAVILRLGSSDDHLATGEDESGRLGLTDTHDHGSETLGVVLGVTGMQCYCLQVQTTVQIDGSDNVLQRGDNAGYALCLLLPRRRGGRHSLLDIALLLAVDTIAHLIGSTILGIWRWRSEMAGGAWVGQGVCAREC